MSMPRQATGIHPNQTVRSIRNSFRFHSTEPAERFRLTRVGTAGPPSESMRRNVRWLSPPRQYQRLLQIAHLGAFRLKFEGKGELVHGNVLSWLHSAHCASQLRFTWAYAAFGFVGVHCILPHPCIFIMVMVSSHYRERSELEPTLRPRVCGVDKALRFLFVAEPKTERYPRP